MEELMKQMLTTVLRIENEIRSMKDNIERLETKMDTGFDRLDKKIDSVENNLSTKIDLLATEGQKDVIAMLQHIDKKLNVVETKIDIIDHRVSAQDGEIKLLKLAK